MPNIRSASLSLAAALLLGGALAACEKDNPGYCGDDCPVDASGIDAVQGCNDDPGVCNATQTCLADVCVDCEANDNTESAQCEDPAAPVCAADHSCRACAADSECDSGWCEAGTCIPSASIVYVHRNAPDDAPCTLAAKCGTPNKAMTLVDATRKYMQIDPDASSYLLPTTLMINKDVIIRGPGATLERTPDEIVMVTGGTVEIRGLAITGTLGGTTSDGIRCSNNAILKLRGVNIHDNEDRGVESGGCTLDIERSRFSGNLASAVRVSNGRFEIRNSYFFRNGTVASVAGGLVLAPNATPNALEFNTIIRNTGDTGGGKAGGIVCTGSTAVTARNNLVYGSVNATREVDGSNCTHSYSVIGASNPPTGTMVRSMTPAELGLKNVAGTSLDDFHIDPNANPPSMLRGGADPVTPASVDYDGDPRTSPADIGADEVP